MKRGQVRKNGESEAQQEGGDERRDVKLKIEGKGENLEEGSV